MADERAEKIRQLNDSFRTSLRGGRVTITGALAQAPQETISLVLLAVVAFDAFTPDDDPYGEHDFGAFDVGGRRYNFKIDYYDLAEENASPDPANPIVTVRIMSVFYAEDY